MPEKSASEMLRELKELEKGFTHVSVRDLTRMQNNNYPHPTCSSRFIGKAMLTVFSIRQKSWNNFYDLALEEPQKFLTRLKKFDKDKAGHLLPHLMKYVFDRDYPLETLIKKQTYLSGLALWILSLYKYLQLRQAFKSL